MSTPDPLERCQLSVSVPWQTEVGAKRLARKRGMSLDDYITGLVEADLEIEAHQLREWFAEEERELRETKEGEK